MMENLSEKILDFLEKKLRARKWKIEAFKLCERCEKFYSFNSKDCPYTRPHSTRCPLFVEVKREKKKDFLEHASAILNEKKVGKKQISAMQAANLRDRIEKESQYIQWGWKFCPDCYSTEWKPAYGDRVRCKNCGRIFT
jgi:hypothetical protein